MNLLTNEIIELQLKCRNIRCIEDLLIRWLTENNKYLLKELLVAACELRHARMQQRDVNVIRKDIIEQ